MPSKYVKVFDHRNVTAVSYPSLQMVTPAEYRAIAAWENHNRRRLGADGVFVLGTESYRKFLQNSYHRVTSVTVELCISHN